jgi:hypothetical protein
MPVNGRPSLIHKTGGYPMTLFFKTTNPCPDWYRENNPAKLDLVDVNDMYSNPLIGLISVIFKPTAQPSFRLCIAEVTLIGVTIYLDILPSRRGDTVYLSIPEGLSLSRKIHAQVLRAYERQVHA